MTESLRGLTMRTAFENWSDFTVACRFGNLLPQSDSEDAGFGLPDLHLDQVIRLVEEDRQTDNRQSYDRRQTETDCLTDCVRQSLSLSETLRQTVIGPIGVSQTV